MNKKWFRIGMAGVFLLSLALRFWGLGRFNTFVFDEVYYAKFANNYLTHTPFFDGHPPLGKYLIAIGIWIGNHFPKWQNEVNGFTGSVMSPVTYRWMNAFSGSFIPPIVAAIAYQISYRRSFALLAGLFTACDGIFLVESRYALINQYIILFGLLGQWFLLLALANQRQQRNWLTFSGMAFGASAATKWNGLWFLLGAYLIWILAWGIRWLQSFSFVAKENPQLPQKFSFHPSLTQRDKKGSKKRFSFSSLSLSISHLSKNRIYKISPSKVSYSNRSKHRQVNRTPLQNLTQLNFIQIIVYLGVIPFIVYGLIWIPHLQLDTRYGFVEVHRQILLFHERLGGNSPKVHPYCAAWYKWPLMTRPMAYFYQTAQTINEPPPVMGPPLPSGTGKVIYDVHAMGNPFLWWFGAAALLFFIGMLVWQFVIPLVKQKRFSPKTICVDTWIVLYLVVNYGANLLPWVGVNRCVFIYHYMTALVFAFLAIAWLVDQCLRSYHSQLRALGVTITFMIAIAFIFWMPIYLGLPLSSFEYRPLRMWFDSWI